MRRRAPVIVACGKWAGAGTPGSGRSRGAHATAATIDTVAARFLAIRTMHAARSLLLPLESTAEVMRHDDRTSALIDRYEHRACSRQSPPRLGIGDEVLGVPGSRATIGQPV